MNDARVVTPVTLPTDGVVIAGEKYDIMHKERLADLVHMWRKQFVSDDDIVLVVKKA